MDIKNVGIYRPNISALGLLSVDPNGTVDSIFISGFTKARDER
ncbi:MAG: hypothetical protein ACI8TQ_003950 [Planctomycetota bacterium]|jgi:hypothetical protein